MKTALFAISLFISILAPAQSMDSIRLKKARWGIVYSPDFCYRLLNYHSSNKWVKEIRNNEEVPMYGFTAGLISKIDLSNRFILETGLLYSIKGEQTKKIDLLWTTPNPELPVKSKTQYKFMYLDIPLKINYMLNHKKTGIFLSAGISANIFSERKTKVKSEFANGNKTSGNSIVEVGYKRFNMASIIGFGIRYDLTKRVSIYAEPVYRQFINSIVVDKKAKEYPYSIGINFGVYYAFKVKNKKK